MKAAAESRSLKRIRTCSVIRLGARMRERYETLDHTADACFRTWGDSVAQLFENAAHALAELAFETTSVQPLKQVPFETWGDDYEALLVDWLSEMLYLFDAGELTPESFQIEELTETTLRGMIWGEPRDPSRHSWKVIVKAVTYHNIEVKNHDGRWEALVVLDI